MDSGTTSKTPEEKVTIVGGRKKEGVKSKNPNKFFIEKEEGRWRSEPIRFIQTPK